MNMTRRMALFLLASLDVPRKSSGQPVSRGTVAFYYGAAFDTSAVDWYTRFAILVTGGFLGPEESSMLMDRGCHLLAYEWSSAFYPDDPVSADAAWQTEALGSRLRSE